MFAQLPESVQETIRSYLEVNDFPTAKSIYDQWSSKSTSYGLALDQLKKSDSASE